MEYDPFSLDTLEFSSVVHLLVPYLSGPIGRRSCEQIAPSSQLEAVLPALELIQEAIEYLREQARPSFASLPDPYPILEKLAVEGAAGTALEVLALTALARAAEETRARFQHVPFSRLWELAARLADFRPLLAELEGKILPDGTVDSSASPLLARLRQSIERTRGEIQTTLERVARRWKDILQEEVITLRNERFVLPVRTEEKRRAEGIVHGASSSGATVFVEPLETVPLNNELAELAGREFAEIQRILAEFSDKLRAWRPELLTAAGLLGTLDLAFAKAEFAREYDGSIPSFSPEGELRLIDVRHPLLEKTLRRQGRRPVPLTIHLAPPQRLMVISGPNAGGKTVALKTVGVAALMAQSGMPVLAAEARLPLFRHILADIGDLQSIEASLSTFSAHITRIQAMAAAAGSDDLVLLDELGGSTDPQEGAALAIAILEHFRQRGAMTLVTTHHSRLKAYAAETPEALNAAMDFDEATLRPAYKLLLGLPGKSSGLEVAARLGLDPAIVARARALLSREETEVARLIADLHELRAALEREREEARQRQAELKAREAELQRRFEAERSAKLRELDQRFARTLAEFEKKWEAALAQVRAEAGGRLSKRLERRGAAVEREAREEWDAQVLEALGEPAEEAAEAGPPGLLALGDRVRLPDFPAPGTVVSLLGSGEVEVEVGRLRLRVRRDQLRRLKPAAGAISSPPSQVGRAWVNAPPVPAEINVIGHTAEEAREEVDKFLDAAYLCGHLRLRVVHGHGKGILKKTLHEMFASHPHVSKFYPAPQQEGGSGATIVELKL
jgi:DNA mismatch repair protein MutS2